MATDQLLQINYLLISRNNPLCFSSTDSGDSGRYPHCHGQLSQQPAAPAVPGFYPKVRRSAELGARTRPASAAWLGTGGSLHAFPRTGRGIVRPQQIHTETLLTGTSSCSCQMAPTYLVQVAHPTKPVLLREPGRGHVAPLLCGASGDGA